MAKTKRPRILSSTTIEVQTGCGGLYVTIGTENGSPMEVLATLGKAGGCSSCQNEALGRSISLGLKYNVPMEDYIKQLKDLRCPVPRMFPKNERCLSCPDGMAIAMEAFLERNNNGKEEDT